MFTRAAGATTGAAAILALLTLTSYVPLARAAVIDKDLPTATPESVGFSSDRLKRLDEVMKEAIGRKEYLGVVTILARHGKIVHVGTLGHKDLDSTAPVDKDTIFRIFSMTKPVTAAAMMILYEEGKWSPQDPVSKFVPQFTDLKVYKGLDPSQKMIVESPAHPPTMHELMTMTAGFTYGLDATPVDRLYRDAQDRNIFFSGSLPALIDRLAQAPLLYAPSSRWTYSVSADIQGYIIQNLTGKSLPTFMRERLFKPLGMRDTDFWIPQPKRPRVATLYRMNEKGQLVATEEATAFGYNYDNPEPMLPMGGGGLVSTATDYYRFAQMILNGGELNGVRILSPHTVKLMMSNHLADTMMTEFRGGGYSFIQPRAGFGYGYNGAVVTDPGLADVPMGKGSYLWDGAAGTWFWIDPTNDIVFVGMIQRWGWGIQGNLPGAPSNLEELSRAATYQALIRPDR
jgi:CubicO group peptidase (beta-lactamase class C family)